MEFESTKAADGLGQAAGANASLAGPGTESEASRHQHTPDIAIAQQTAHVGDAGAAAASAPVAIVEPANPAGPTVISRLQETAQGSVDARQERLDIQVQAGQTLFFDGIDLSSARIQDLEGGILITLADGTVIFLAGFVGAAQSSNPPVVQASGGQPSAADGPQFAGATDTDLRVITISASDLLAAARGAPLNLQPAAGPAAVGGGGARFATVDSGDDGIGEGLGRSGLLGADPSNPPAADESIPPAAFQGAGDGSGGSDSATVEVTVDAVNDAPVAADDDASTDEDNAVDISVLANDGDADGDP
ncbi:MAG: Ig-like domain-containing protein, partial [Alphaproteobacteria bacterium]|nr:Ig-like domain-containing protein [Alphaproteobacteria bacterium]